MTSAAYTKMVEEAEEQIRTLKRQKAVAMQKAQLRKWTGSTPSPQSQEADEIHEKVNIAKTLAIALGNV